MDVTERRLTYKELCAAWTVLSRAPRRESIPAEDWVGGGASLAYILADMYDQALAQRTTKEQQA